MAGDTKCVDFFKVSLMHIEGNILPGYESLCNIWLSIFRTPCL